MAIVKKLSFIPRTHTNERNVDQRVRAHERMSGRLLYSVAAVLGRDAQSRNPRRQ